MHAGVVALLACLVVGCSVYSAQGDMVFGNYFAKYVKKVGGAHDCTERGRERG